MTAAVTIERALTDGRLLGARFGDGLTWRAWFAILKAAYGRPLTKTERAAFDRVAGGRKPPRRKVRELVVVASRRAGKGSMAGAVACYESALVQHDLAPGERGVVACVSATKEQATIVREYAGGFFQASSILKCELVDSTADELRLRNGTVVSTLAADYRSLRGRTLLCAILDEAAFMQDDVECARALLPGLATTGGMLLILSSPFSRSGLVYSRYQEFFGRDDDDVLVVAGPSELFNPTLDPKMLAAARAADPEGARSEWGGEFRSDIGALFDDAMIEAAVDRARPLELPPREGVNYVAFCDPAGGAEGDSYCVAIAHKENGSELVVDVVRGTAGRFDPQAATADFAALLRCYKISTVVGDAFAGDWVASAWREDGITYVQSDRKRSDLYLDALPFFARALVRLPDHSRLLRELRTLERRTGRNGKEIVNHPRGGTDDYANALCGALRLANVAPPSLWQRELLVGDDATPKWADYLFAVVVASKQRIGVAYFAYRAKINPPLLLLDYQELPIAPQSFHAIVDRLWHFVGMIRTGAATVFTHSVLASEFERIGYTKAIEVIDGIAADKLLAVSAAKHIGADRVKLAPEARARAQTVPLGLLDGTIADDGDPLRLAVMVGVAVALDPGRELGRRAA